jgi:hypothetical protein
MSSRAHLFSASARRAHSVNPRQFMDALLAALPGGQRIIHVHNSSGLSFTLLPDRCLDIWTASYNGLPLTWISQGAPHPADYGSSWLRQFNGGLLTTCGFTHAGPPERDTETGELRDLHGNATRLTADELSITRPDDDHLCVRAVLAESRLFGEQIRVERTCTVAVGVPSVVLTDVVTNAGAVPVPFMLLYHFNVGYPLVRAGTRLWAASRVKPRDEAAAAGLNTWAHYDAPTAGYAEQVFFHQVYAQDQRSAVALANDDLALMLEWDTTHAPYFTQWKNTHQGIYVSGIEPGNCIPEGQNSAREQGRLVFLNPGESQRFESVLTVASDPAGISAMTSRVKALEAQGQLLAACRL